MHAVIPRTLYCLTPNTRKDVGKDSYVLWVTTDEQFVDVSKYNYFKEKRREDFSDVCHAKLLSTKRPDERHILPSYSTTVMGGRTVWFVPYKHFDDQSGSTWFSSWTLQSDGHCARSSYGRSSRKSRKENYAQLEAKAAVRRGRYTYECSFRYTATWNKSSKTLRVNTWTYGGLSSAEAASVKNILDNYAMASDAVSDSGHRAFAQKLHDGALGLSSYLASIVETRGSTAGGWQNVTPIAWEMPNLRQSFLLHEPGVLMDGEDDLFYGRGTEKYFRNVLIQESFLSMFESVPRLNENSISNVLEIISFIKTLVIDRKVEIPKSLSSAWLAYRYQYTTTKLDANQAIEFVHRHMDLGDWHDLKCYGTSTLAYKDTSIMCRCVANVRPRMLETVGKVWRALYTYGLTPNFYVIWDMIPYSFIVDWFLPIGDIMAVWDARHAMEEYYDISNVIYSLKYVRNERYGDVSFYTRWLSGPPPELSGFYTLERRGPSDKTVIKRVLDGAALILG